MTRNTHDRQYDHHGQDLDTNLIISADTTATTSGQSLHDAILDLETWVQSLGVGGAVASYALELDDAGGGITDHIVIYIGFVFQSRHFNLDVLRQKTLYLWR